MPFPALRPGLAVLLAAGAMSVAPTVTPHPAPAAAAAAAPPTVQAVSHTPATLDLATRVTARTSRVVRQRLRRAVRRLPVAGETRRGYDRDKFRHWIDADGDCQDTRDEVLKAESRVRVSGCDIRTGRWQSWYDGAVWTDSSDVDIDHMVPLAEAWDSGARRWNAATRQRFANDLADRRSLTAVTDEVNQAKSDQDPAEWLPGRNRCTYVRHWVAVKVRWRLTVDRSEKRTLRRRASNCANTVIKVRRARIGTRSSGGDSDGGGGGGGGCSPAYRPCVPPPPPDLNCSDLDGPIYLTGSRDPHNLDGDGDGVACE